MRKVFPVSMYVCGTLNFQPCRDTVPYLTWLIRDVGVDQIFNGSSFTPENVTMPPKLFLQIVITLVKKKLGVSSAVFIYCTSCSCEIVGVCNLVSCCSPVCRKIRELTERFII